MKKRLITDTPYVSNLITPQKSILEYNTSTSFIYNEHAFFQLHMRKQCLDRHAALILEGRVQDPILQPSCTKSGGKTSLFVRPRHAKNRIDEPLLSPNKCTLNILPSFNAELSVPGQKECTIGVHRHHLYGKYKGVRVHSICFYATSSIYKIISQVREQCKRSCQEAYSWQRSSIRPHTTCSLHTF